MSKSLIAGALALAVALAAYLVFGRNDEAAEAPPVAEDAAEDAGPQSGPPTGRDLATVEYWPLPSAGRSSGVSEVRLVDNIDAWIQSIPLDRREEVIRFVNSYPNAYRIESREQQLWMISHGFPSLEEVAAFDVVADTAGCEQIHCSRGKLAALAADAALNDLDEYLKNVFPSGPRDIGRLPPEFRGDVALVMARANDYISRARDNGSPLFAAYLRSRLSSIIGDREGREAAQAFLAACGDPRARPSSPESTLLVSKALSSGAGGRSSCGYGPGRPPFPK